MDYMRRNSCRRGERVLVGVNLGKIECRDKIEDLDRLGLM